jgi:hypothetical protein
LCPTPYKRIQFIKSAKKSAKEFFPIFQGEIGKNEKSQKCKISNYFFPIFQGEIGKNEKSQKCKISNYFFRYFKAKSENQPLTNSLIYIGLKLWL